MDIVHTGKNHKEKKQLHEEIVAMKQWIRNHEKKWDDKWPGIKVEDLTDGY